MSSASYAAKKISIEGALSKIKSGDMIVSALGAAEPTGILGQLHTIAPRVTDVAVSTCLPMRPHKFFMDPAMRGHIYHDAWFFSPGVRKAFEEVGTSSFVPNHLHRAGLDRLIYRRPTVFVGTCTPPDSHGHVSLSLSATYEREMMTAADLVILEVNENMPYTFGDTIVHIDEVDYFVDNTLPLAELPIIPITEKDLKIAEYIADFVEDGSCLQLGIGGMPNAVGSLLTNKRNLSIHTEMFTDGMVDLYEAGCIGNESHLYGTFRHKKVLTGKMVATFALGTKKLYDFIDRNPSVAMMRGCWVNDPYVIANNHKQVSINTAMEIDLTGQVCSESIGPRQFSGTGGQVDTAVGAQLTEGGKSVIALFSTTEVKQADGTRKTISKIMPMLTPGAAVTLHRSNVDYVATEYGVVRIKGCPIRERAKRLISIAHPDFRAELEEQADRLGMLGK